MLNTIEPITVTSGALAKMESGMLNVRIDRAFKGDWLLIKESFNKTQDTVAIYIAEISGILKQMSGQNFNITISREFKGDFEQIKTSLELIISTFGGVLRNINSFAGEISQDVDEMSNSSDLLTRALRNRQKQSQTLTTE